MMGLEGFLSIYSPKLQRMLVHPTVNTLSYAHFGDVFCNIFLGQMHHIFTEIGSKVSALLLL